MEALKKITEGMTGQESAQIIYQNDANALSDYIVSHFHPTGGEGGTNVYTLSTAVVKIPQDIRKIGMTCTFLSSGGWQSYKYIGTTAEDKDWETTDNWMAVPTQKEIGSESTSESEDGSVWGKLISLEQDTTVHSKEISDLNDESDKLQADMTNVKSGISKLDKDMDNAYTQNGCLFCRHGMVNINFHDDNVSINFPSQVTISYSDTLNVVHNQGDLSVPYDFEEWFLVLDLEDNKLKLVSSINQMTKKVLVGWINVLLKSALLRCSDYSINGKPMNPTKYLSASEILNVITSTATDLPLSANMGRILSTQNAMMHVYTDNVFATVNFSKTDTSVTISLPRNLLLSYGNTRIGNSATESGQEIIDPMTDDKLKYLVYDLSEKQYKLVKYSSQMSNSILVGWVNGFLKEAILKCNRYRVYGVSQSPDDYIPNSDIVHDLTTTDENKVLGADQAGVLATQNGMMQCTISGSKVEVNYNANYTEITISLPPELHITYGNSRIINASTSNGTVVKATSSDSFGKYLVYNLVTNSFEFVKYDSQMKDCILLGWMYLKPYLGNCILLCDDYSVNGMPASNNSLAEIAYNNIPTTVIQLKKNSDEGFISMIMTSLLIDSEINITGGYVSLSTNIGTETSVKIKKGVSNRVYFKCIDPFAVIEAKGVYDITNTTHNNNCYVIGNVRDFGEGATYISLASDNNVTGEIKDFNRKMTYILINSGPFSNPKLSGKLEDLPRLLTYLRLTSAGISITGNVSDLPRKLTYMYLNTGSPIDMSGDVSDLPLSLEQIMLYGLTDIFTGDVADLPRGLVSIIFSGTNYNISGNIADLPPNVQNLQISGLSTVHGDISEFPRELKSITLSGNCNLKGSLSGLPTNTNVLNLQSIDSANPITGDISEIPNKRIVHFSITKNFNVTFNGEFPMSDQVYYFQLQPSEVFPIDSATIDNILIKLAAIAGKRTGTRTIDLTGACAAPTEASQSAIESLQQKGFTVTTNK